MKYYLKLLFLLALAVFLSSSSAFAKTYFLPDYQAGFGGSKNDSSIPPATPKCSSYGWADSCVAGQTGTLVHPYPGKNCYKDCKPACGPTVTVGTGEVCNNTCEGKCVSKTCKPNTNLDSATEDCTERCAANSAICTAKRCKAAVSYDSNTEQCNATCKSNSSICVSKGCKSGVSFDPASERCLVTCKSNSSICITKGCKTAVTVDPKTEQCKLTCTSNTSTCVEKTCKTGYGDTSNFWCTVPKSTDCATLGYNETTKICGSQQFKLHCPFDETKYACMGAKICALGDIYYSDETCSANIVNGKTPIGVVGYVNKDGRSGLLVALEEKNKAWSSEYYDLPCISNVLFTSGGGSFNQTNAQNAMGGKSNTACIVQTKNSRSATYDAGIYCANYTIDGASGWFLPSSGEAHNTLFLGKKQINETLGILGKTKIALEEDYRSWYSTSTETTTTDGNTNENVWVLLPGNGYLYQYHNLQSNKNSSLIHARCVREF